MQDVLPFIQSFLVFTGAASVFAKALAAGLPALKQHAYASSWKAESVAYEAYATFVTGFAAVCEGALWLFKKLALNVGDNVKTTFRGDEIR